MKYINHRICILDNGEYMNVKTMFVPVLWIAYNHRRQGFREYKSNIR
ncbi:MAG: hypothetical protein LBB45_09645 [Methanobrevibacter sp.]|nr:hypothetical protein [Candidatus Methanovirga basalitermitum]